MARILILGSVALPVPPPAQGGTEWMAYHQADGLAKRGHKVTLVAAVGSLISDKYELIQIGGGDTVEGTQSSELKAEGMNSGLTETVTETSRKMRKEAVYWAEVEQFLLANGRNFDVIINNMRAFESILLPIAGSLKLKVINVMHLPLFRELGGLFRKFNPTVVTISDAQRLGFDDINFGGTVYNCVDVPKYDPVYTPGKYLLVMGSIAPHKNQADAIKASLRLGKKIILAGKIGSPQYFKQEIEPQLDGNNIIHVGEIEFGEKVKLLAGACALLFPVIWPEPFGLVMIEAMACGTPVIAYNNGAVPEVIRDGITGFIIEKVNFIQNSKLNESRIMNQESGLDGAKFFIKNTGVEGLVEAIKRIGDIDRRACRKHVEDNFTVEKMIDGYERVIRKIL